MLTEATAAATIAILSPYLKEGVTSFSKKAGEVLATKVDSLYQTIKKKFAGDHDAEQALNQVETKPESQARQAALEETLNEKIKSDEPFAKILTQLVQEIRSLDSKGVVTASGERNISVRGDITNSVLVTGDRNRTNQ